MIDLEAAFEECEDEFLRFELVENKLHPRPDLCAFLLLDRLLPNGGQDMVCAAEHDIIYLNVDCERLAEVATQDDILTLARCGVHYDSETESLAMFA